MFIDKIIHIHILRINAILVTNHLSTNIIYKSMQHYIQNQFINQHFVRNLFFNQQYIQIIYQSTLFTKSKVFTKPIQIVQVSMSFTLECY